MLNLFWKSASLNVGKTTRMVLKQVVQNSAEQGAQQKPLFEPSWLSRQFEQWVPEPEIRFVIGITSIAIMIAILIFVIGKVRNIGTTSGSEFVNLKEFNNLYEQGAFSDEEMAKIRSSFKIRENAKKTKMLETMKIDKTIIAEQQKDQPDQD